MPAKRRQLSHELRNVSPASAPCSPRSARPPSALASSHAEAPGTASDPDTDNTDVWAWRKGNNLIVLANYNGLQPAYAAPNWKKFADDALYEVHIARGPDQPGRRASPTRSSSRRRRTRGSTSRDLTQARRRRQGVLRADLGRRRVRADLQRDQDRQQATRPCWSRTPRSRRPTSARARTRSPTRSRAEPRTSSSSWTTPATSVITSLGSGGRRVFAGPRDDRSSSTSARCSTSPACAP